MQVQLANTLPGNATNTQGHNDSDYLAAFLEVLMPVACEFAPELVLISAGFDPAIGCPEGEQEVLSNYRSTSSVLRLPARQSGGLGG